MSASTPNPTLTLKDIAREAGVSLATVDRVLHERPGVRPGTIKRVKDTIERHEFRPLAAAADLARGRTRRFAVVMTVGSNLFMQQILSHLSDDMKGWLSARRIVVTAARRPAPCFVLTSRRSQGTAPDRGASAFAIGAPVTSDPSASFQLGPMK